MLGSCARSGEQTLTLPSDFQRKLATMRAEPKFQADAGGLYTGVHNEAERLRAEGAINALIDRLEREVSAHPTKRFVLGAFSRTLSQIELSDTEDRERACAYLEQIMDIVGLKSSDGLLNRWLYGFDPRRAKRASP